jgi:multiple sugar transport system substrate-binding protein
MRKNKEQQTKVKNQRFDQLDHSLPGGARYGRIIIGKMEKRPIKNSFFLFLPVLAAASMLLTACGSAATSASPAPAIQTPTTLPTKPPVSSPIQIRWSVGMGDGSDPAQVSIENDVVNDFNASQTRIHLVLEVVPKETAVDTFATEIAAGVGPDIVGPLNWFEANIFNGQWLDLKPYMASSGYDTSRFDPAMVKSYQNDEGTLALPFVVYPSAIYYNTSLFSKAGLNPPPARYGEKYRMPDGNMVDWTWDTLANVAKDLTIDAAGKHSGEAGFDATRIVQYGFSFGWENHPNYWATFMTNGGSILMPGGSKGNDTAKIPDDWKAAWEWVDNGIWGAEPYIPGDTVTAGPNFDLGNVFASGKVAMLDNPSSYLCCLGDLTQAGGKFELGSMPIGLDGKVAGRVDEETFRIWKGTTHPTEAFTVLTYLIDTGTQKLVIGSPQAKPAYSGIPGIAANRGAWLAAQQAQFPFVQNWQTLLDGMNYPDVPSAEASMPNINEAWARIESFGTLLSNTRGVDLTAQEASLQTDLTNIFNK